MNITFVATRKNEDRSERELYEMDLVLGVLGLDRAFVDLGLLTVAAATPAGMNVRVVDEYHGEIDYDAPTDLVALSAKTSCVTRAYKVADEFRRRGKKVVLGGIHASLRPDEALEHVDCVVTNEAEALWPIVAKDAAEGKLKSRYDALEFPDMAHLPIPNWTAQEARGRHLFHQIQTTRGCPYQCRFCSVPSISGQKFRFKPVERVLAEIKALPSGRGTSKNRPLYIVDDNFISRTKYTKELLTALVPLHQSGAIPPWSAETTLNVAQDDELLDLFRDAGCATLIIGIESISEATLKAMDKGINFCLTYQDAIDRIHARGLAVVGNFIVGFDTDTRDVFRDLRDFVEKTGILFPFFSILTPMPGTALFDDTKAAGRLFHEDWARYDTRHVTFQPNNLTPNELIDGYVWLYEQTYGEAFLGRLEKHWQRRPTKGRKWLEKAFIGSQLGLHAVRGDRELRDLYRRGLRLLASRRLHSEPGNLLIGLDGYDFARFMRKFNSPDRARNYAAFEVPVAADESLLRRQWDNDKAQRRSAKLTA